jgi:hypothetical protein
MRMGNSSLSATLAAMPRGVAWAVDSRNMRVGSGVAPGAKTFFIVLCGKLGEKRVAGGLSLMADARKMLRAAAIELLFKLLDGTSSRVVSSLRDEAAFGVPLRLAEPPAKGDAAKLRFAKGRGGRGFGVPFALSATLSSPGREKVTISRIIREKV